MPSSGSSAEYRQNARRYAVEIRNTTQGSTYSYRDTDKNCSGELLSLLTTAFAFAWTVTIIAKERSQALSSRSPRVARSLPRRLLRLQTAQEKGPKDKDRARPQERNTREKTKKR